MVYPAMLRRSAALQSEAPIALEQFRGAYDPCFIRASMQQHGTACSGMVVPGWAVEVSRYSQTRE